MVLQLKKILPFLVLLIAGSAYAERQLVTATASFTRPSNTTTYTAGFMVANNTTSTSVTPMSFQISSVQSGTAVYVRRARVSVTSTSVTAPNFRIHLYNTSPTPTVGDGAAYMANQAASWLCDVDVNMYTTLITNDGNMGAGTPTNGTECGFSATGTVVYGLMEARGAYQPGSASTFTVTLEMYAP